MNKIFMTYEAQESPPDEVLSEDRIVINSSAGAIEKKYNIKGKLTSLVVPRGRDAELVFKLAFALPDDSSASQVQFELLGANNKPIFSKTFIASEVINEDECIIKIAAEDTVNLKQESYKIEITYLDQAGGAFKIFNESYPVLTIK
jgi:hypothetical protein